MLGCKKVMRDDQNAKIFKHYHINTKLLSVKILYNRMIINGINLSFALLIFPCIIDLYESGFEARTSDSSILINTLNNFVKEFIWKYFQFKNEKID